MRHGYLAITGLLAFATQAFALQSMPSAELLGREIPRALVDGKFEQLSPYFDDNVRLTTNLPDAASSFEGKKLVFLALSANLYRRSGIFPTVSSVVIASDRVVVVQNVPDKAEFDKMDLAPKIDTFYLNSDNKIYLIESFIGSKAKSELESKPHG